MSRNRVKNSQSLHWMGVLKWILIMGLMSILGLSYMLCKNQNLHIAEETLKLQRQLNAVQARNHELASDLEGMKSPRELERRLAQMHSTLVRLDEMRSSVVRMDQNTRAKVARIGTSPQSGLNLGSPVVATSATSPQPAQQ